MTLAQYARVLRQQWWLVLLLAALALGGAAFYTHSVTPQYQASVQLFVSTSGKSDVSDLSQGSSFTQQRVKSYADIVTSPSVLSKVIQQLSLPYTTGQLAEHITADSPLDTVLLNVTVTDPHPEYSAAIANAIAAEFPNLIDRLETPAGSSTSPVKVSVTQGATVPTVPVSPRKSLNYALGLLVGLGLGVGAAVLRDQLNTRVRSVADVEAITKTVPLGVVPFDPDAKKQPLVTADKFGARAEAFRSLRTNLQFANVDDPPRVIVVTSPMPDEGKTTSACNIALTLALSGAMVILVEADLRKPRVGTYLGIESSAGLTTVLSGQHELRNVVVNHNRNLMAVLPAGRVPPNPSELLGSQHMSNLIATLKNHYDYIIIDAPPLLPVTDASVLAADADGALLIVRHGKTRREQVARAVQALQTVNAKLIGTMVNFAPRKGGGGYEGYGYGTNYSQKNAEERALHPRSASQAQPSPPAQEPGLHQEQPPMQGQNGWQENGYTNGNYVNGGSPFPPVTSNPAASQPESRQSAPWPLDS